MKIRNGFVSNSSSSSFMIPNGDISYISNKMLKIIIEDRDYLTKKENKTEYTKLSSNLKKALNRKDVKSGKIGVFIRSCNYDTFIVLNEDVLYVSTSNNYNFELGYRDEEYSNSDKIYDVINSKYYYDVHDKIIHSHSEYNESYQCNKCKLNYGMCFTDLKGNMLCAECCSKMTLSKKGEKEKKENELIKKNKEKFSKNSIFSIDLKSED